MSRIQPRSRSAFQATPTQEVTVEVWATPRGRPAYLVAVCLDKERAQRPLNETRVKHGPSGAVLRCFPRVRG